MFTHFCINTFFKQNLTDFDLSFCALIGPVVNLTADWTHCGPISIDHAFTHHRLMLPLLALCFDLGALLFTALPPPC